MAFCYSPTARAGLLVGAFALLLAACAAPQPLTTADYRASIPALEAEVGLRPNDAETLTDLGEAYVQTEQYEKAEGILRQARRLRSDDARSIYYLGLAKEGIGERTEAVQLYANYEQIPRTSPYRRLLAGRHAYLNRTLLREEFAALVAAEDSLVTDGQLGGYLEAEEATGVIAVLPLTYRGEQPRYAPLARGLSEMLTVDLASVEALRVVERLRLQALLKELRWSQTRRFDPETSARVGRLLRTERVVGGSVDVRSGAIRADVALWARGSDGMPEPAMASADLDDLFRMEKELAFALIEELQVELTPEERDRIERIPTRNLQAFLAYSRGLEEEDAGNFDAAADLFNEAGRLDPSFSEATEKAEATAELASASGDVVEAVTAARGAQAGGGGYGGRGGGASTPRQNLVGDRLGQLNQNIGGAVLPGGGDGEGEGREPAAETPATVDPPVLEPIPDPPLPGGN